MHCFETIAKETNGTGYDAKKLRVYIGTSKIDFTPQTVKHLYRVVDFRLPPPRGTLFDYDMILLMLNETVSPRLTPLCLSTNEEIRQGLMCTAAGWGLPEARNQLPKQ